MVRVQIVVTDSVTVPVPFYRRGMELIANQSLKDPNAKDDDGPVTVKYVDLTKHEETFEKVSHMRQRMSSQHGIVRTCSGSSGSEHQRGQLA